MWYHFSNTGLVLDIIGVLVLAKTGFPPKFDPEGKTRFAFDSKDAAEIAKGKLFLWLSNGALALIVLGFSLQFYGNMLSGNASAPTQEAPAPVLTGTGQVAPVSSPPVKLGPVQTP